GDLPADGVPGDVPRVPAAAEGGDLHGRPGDPEAGDGTHDRPVGMAALEGVWIAPGTFRMGSDRHYREEAPVRRVSVDGFRIDRFQTTNREFARFVDETGYVTVAERPLDPDDFPGAPPENLVPGSLVFTMTRGEVDLRHLSQWWTWTPGASW